MFYHRFFMSPDLEKNARSCLASRFGTTHWSVVVAAAQTDSSEAESAMERLCIAYWKPLYSYLRRKGCNIQEAEDLSQGFFSQRVVTKLVFKGVHPERGKFRTWLLSSLQNFVKNEWNRQMAIKRGGRVEHFSLDLDHAEAFYLQTQLESDAPARAFDRSWAIALLENALENFKQQYDTEHKLKLFEALQSFLPGASIQSSYAEAAIKLGKSEDAIKMAASRFRKDFGRVLKDEIKRTVSTSSEVKEELYYLISLLGEH